MEYRNLQGDKMKKTYLYLKNKGYNYVISYNLDYRNIFNFTDRFFKTEAGAKKFYNNIKKDTGMVSFKELKLKKGVVLCY